MKNSSYNSDSWALRHVNDHILSQKRATHVLQTMRLQHLRLCTAGCKPEPVNNNAVVEAVSDRRMAWPAAERWLLGDWWTKKKFLGLQMNTSLIICFNIWSSTHAVNILTLNYWNLRVWHCVSLNYYGAPAFALWVSVEKPKLVLCFTTYHKIVRVNRRRLYSDTLHQKSLISD